MECIQGKKIKREGGSLWSVYEGRGGDNMEGREGSGLWSVYEGGRGIVEEEEDRKALETGQKTI